jgi:hypothetical protein
MTFAVRNFYLWLPKLGLRLDYALRYGREQSNREP